jgi:heme-degrading monooxygenase HmoA
MAIRKLKENAMIIRSWKAKALSGNVDAYARHLRDSVLPALRLIPGHKGAYLLKKGAGTSLDLVVLTLWDSMDAIYRFAGESAEEAVVEPAAQAVLEAFDRSVDHYEVVLSSVGSAAPVES